MKQAILITSLFFSLTAFAEDTCQVTSVMATYQIETVTKSNHSTDKNELILLRHGKSVFHINDNKIATQWTKLPNAHMKKTSYFIDDKRAIEYEATKNNLDNVWQYHAQLLHPRFQSQLKLVETVGSGCEKLEHYQQTTDSKNIDVWWYPEKKIAKSIQHVYPDTTINWQLTHFVNSKTKVQQKLDILMAYHATDFADIGDNEADPFFRKMINLGFIDHHASGFYDSQGNAISGNDHSSHQH